MYFFPAHLHSKKILVNTLDYFEQRFHILQNQNQSAYPRTYQQLCVHDQCFFQILLDHGKMIKSTLRQLFPFLQFLSIIQLQLILAPQDYKIQRGYYISPLQMFMNKDQFWNSKKLRNKGKEKKSKSKKDFDSDEEYDIFEESSLDEEKCSQNSFSFSFEKSKKDDQNKKLKRKRSRGIKQLQQETIQHRTIHQQFDLLEKSLKHPQFPSNFNDDKVDSLRNEETNKKIISLDEILQRIKDRVPFSEEELKNQTSIEEDCPIQSLESYNSSDKKFKNSQRNQKDRFKNPFESNKRTLVRKIFSDSQSQQFLPKNQGIVMKDGVKFLKMDFYQERFYYLMEINKKKVWIERQKVIDRHLPQLVQFYEKFLKFI